MATYTFKCNGCGHYTEETNRKFGDNSVPDKCQHCDAEDLTQVIESNNFILKGSGWYKASHYGRDWKLKR